MNAEEARNISTSVVGPSLPTIDYANRIADAVNAGKPSITLPFSDASSAQSAKLALLAEGYYCSDIDTLAWPGGSGVQFKVTWVPPAERVPAPSPAPTPSPSPRPPRPPSPPPSGSTFTVKATSNVDNPIEVDRYVSVGINLGKGNIPPTSATIDSGSIPDGLVMTTELNYVMLSGRPQTLGTFSGVVTVGHSTPGYTPPTVNIPFSIVVAPPAPFTATSLTSNGNPGMAQVGSNISLEDWGGYIIETNLSTVTATLLSGELPPGTKLGTNQTQVRLSGTPTAAGTYTGTVRMVHGTDAVPEVLTRSFVIVVVDAG
jgi:hypothetical protein